MKYKDYVDSKEWENKSSSYLNEHKVCELCRKHKSVEAHHTSYKRFMNESEEDLMALCERCHKGIHNFPPKIANEIQKKKAVKIMDYFRKYPRLKTLVMNDISKKYFKNRTIIEVASEFCDETPLFVQNFLEIIYEKGLEENVDIIEETLTMCIAKRIEASKNTRSKRKQLIDMTKKYESGEVKYVSVRYEAPIEVIATDENTKKNFCLAALNDKNTLSKAKSYMNNTYYDGKVYFNMIGAKTATDFYLKILNDGFSDELFKILGGEMK